MVPLGKIRPALGYTPARVSSQHKAHTGNLSWQAMFSIALWKLQPQPSAMDFVTTTPLNTGVNNISQAGLSGRIQVKDGNFFSDDLSSGYDSAIIFNISQRLTPVQNTDLFGKVSKAHNVREMAVILEQFGTDLEMQFSRASNNILGSSYYHLPGGQVNS